MKQFLIIGLSVAAGFVLCQLTHTPTVIKLSSKIEAKPQDIKQVSIQYDTVTREVDTAAILRDCLATKKVEVKVSNEDSTHTGTAFITLKENKVIGFKLESQHKILTPIVKTNSVKRMIGVGAMATGNENGLSASVLLTYTTKKHLTIGGGFDPWLKQYTALIIKNF
jgi:hypothetical protein